MEDQRQLINFTVACINEFAHEYQIEDKDVFQYLYRFNGIKFIKENYDIEHTMPFSTIIEDLTIICKKNGGKI